MRNAIGIGALGALAAAAGCAPASASAQAQGEVKVVAAAVTPDEVVRVPVAEARGRVQEGRALLVCAYEGDDKFAAMKLEGAISWKALGARLASLDRKTEIILYCG